MQKIHCSIGVIVYNEAENIGKLIKSLQHQKLKTIEIDEIVVVSSACTDGTDDIVRKLAEEDGHITLITEAERNGKSAAINKFIRHSSSEVLVIESGDTIPAEDTVEKMVSVFHDPKTGMSGGRPYPENCRTTPVGKAVHILWELHHRMAEISPKLGEMVAFRNVVEEIPEKSAVDEASIEAIIRDAGYKLVYVPDALVYNKGPENWKEFISQRRRIASGHIWLKDQQSYSVSSQDGMLLLRLAIDHMLRKPKDIPGLITTGFVEVYSRIMGWIDLKILKKNPFKWDIAKSTKKMQRER